MMTAILRLEMAAPHWRVLAGIAAIFIATAILTLPAVWNGYTLFYYDSVDYIRMPFSWTMPVWRTMPYAVVAAVGRVFGSLWAIPIAQSLIMAYVLYEALRTFTRLPPAVTLVPVTAVLAALTGLPWFTSQMMPDAFTGVVVLGIAVLAFGADRISLRRRLLIGALVALGVAVHTTHIAVGAGLVLFLGALRLAVRSHWRGRAPVLDLSAVAVVTGIGLVFAIHWATSGKPFLTQPNSKLMLGRLVQDGLAKRYLDEFCPTGKVRLILCRYRDKFPPTANQFLWHHSPGFDALGGWTGAAAETEAKAIINGTLRKYPLQHAVTALRLTGEQLLMVGTGDGFEDQRWNFTKAIGQFYPFELKGYLRARQQTDNLLAKMTQLNRLHVPVLFLAMILTATLLVAWARQRDWKSFGFALVVTVALLGNAFVCGALSNPNHRYQSRVAWLAVLVVAVAAARRLESLDAGRMRTRFE